MMMIVAMMMMMVYDDSDGDDDKDGDHLLVTSLKKVKSNTTVPYIKLLNCVPAMST